ncbi:hypothetical protein PC116_g3596 [Phytophthora cactorum]|uniref:Uncharacterized protein n=1 Tax=Phytophthora cactorum TaxID=29920 RepID=A0A8T1LM25_9STRA|nr:hypothetical protein Pcac1_g13651 [Phytophthora cactorum]KAG2846060.1 hypothetical protein PC112_g1603 [Phytophthora cactorum]KAG2931943.1 hypothetical protein PC114_g1964 [Phytophthora cactorum]KAG2953827.1 hypothetical protein PC117_g1724 [Phytophthora cactorum]KAG3014467.1 hypothetical protein PC120_g12665 [Phytophthora cactorum]
MNDIIKVVGTTGSSAAYKGYMGQDQFLTSTNTIGGLTPAGFIKFFHDLLQSKSSDVQRELTVRGGGALQLELLANNSFSKIDVNNGVHVRP